MRTHPVCINQFLFFLVAVSGEETQIARGENIELITTVTVHFRIMTVSTTATTSIALRAKKGLFCH